MMMQGNLTEHVQPNRNDLRLEYYKTEIVFKLNNRQYLVHKKLPHLLAANCL